MTFKKTAILFSVVGLAGVLSACGDQSYPLENKNFTQELTSTFSITNTTDQNLEYKVEPLDRVLFFRNHQGRGSYGCHAIYHNKNDNREQLNELDDAYRFGSYTFNKVGYSLTGDIKGTIAAGDTKSLTVTEKFDIAYSVAGSGSTIELYRKLDNIRAKVKVYNNQYEPSKNYAYFISDDNYEGAIGGIGDCEQGLLRDKADYGNNSNSITEYAFRDIKISNQVGLADSKYNVYSGRAAQVKKFEDGSVLTIKKVYPQKSVYGESIGENYFLAKKMVNDTTKPKVLGVVQE